MCIQMEKTQPQEILQAIREGHGFISNGPLVTAEVNGVSYGEKAVLKDRTGTLSVHVVFKETDQSSVDVHRC